MKILVSGSSGHLGEAIMRVLRQRGENVLGIDLQPSSYTDLVGSVTDRPFVHQAMNGITHILHTATLHKPHVISHSRQQFIDTNITGTLNLLEEATEAGVKSFVFTSTTSTFGDSLKPPPGAPAAWITEETIPIPKNIYGVTKTAAEDLCRIFHRNQKLPCLILRTSRFFPEEDDEKGIAESYADAHVKTNEFLYRRVDIEDVVNAHLLALEKAPSIGFGCYIVSATTPFTRSDLSELNRNAHDLIKKLYPDYEALYRKLDWRMFPVIERVYVNQKARIELGWLPKYDFQYVLDKLKSGEGIASELAAAVGSKGYHK